MRMSVSRTIALAILLLPGAEVAQGSSHPTIQSVAITSTPTIDADQDGVADTYGVGEHIDVTVTWDADVAWNYPTAAAFISTCVIVGAAGSSPNLVTGGATSGQARSLVAPPHYAGQFHGHGRRRAVQRVWHRSGGPAQ